MSIRPRKISDQSAKEIRDQIQNWIQKFGRLDQAVVEFQRRRIATERHTEELKEKYPPSLGKET